MHQHTVIYVMAIGQVATKCKFIRMSVLCFV